MAFPDYQSYYDPYAVGQYAGQGFGGPRSPAFNQMAPVDFMSRRNESPGATGMAAPFGQLSANPAINMLIQGIVAPKIFDMMGMDYGKFSKNLAPFGRYDGGMADWMEQRHRFDAFVDPRNQARILDNTYDWSAFGSYNKMAQGFWDSNLNPAGSGMQTAQTIYGRFGSMFAGDHNQQAQTALKMFENLNAGFSSKNAAGQDFFDYNKSYGYNRPQLADLTDTAVRRGIGGLSQYNVEDLAKDPGKFKDKVGGIAKFMSSASEIFGKDKGFDELAQLVEKAVGSLATVDTARSTNLLQKIQASARALTVSSEAMAEYVGLFNDLDKSMGGAGIGNTQQALRSAMMGEGLASGNRQTGSDGRATGGVVDVNRMTQGEARMQAGAANSYRGKWTLGFFSAFDRLSDSEKASRGADGRTINEMKQDLVKALESGDPNKLAEAQLKIRRAQAGAGIMSTEFLDTSANNLSESQQARGKEALANEGIDLGRALQARPYHSNMEKTLAAGFASGQNRGLYMKAGGAEGLRKLMGSLNDEEAMTSSNVVEKIMARPGNTLSREEAKRYASIFAAQANLIDARSKVQAGIFTDTADDPVAKARAWAEGGEMQKQMEIAQGKKEMQAALAIQLGEDQKGAILKGMGLADASGAVLKEYKPAMDKVIKDAMDNEKYDIGKSGWRAKDWLALTKAAGKDITMDLSRADEIAAFKEDSEWAESYATDIYDSLLSKGVSPADARKRALMGGQSQMDGARRNRAAEKKKEQDWFNSMSPEEQDEVMADRRAAYHGQNDTPEAKGATDVLTEILKVLQAIWLWVQKLFPPKDASNRAPTGTLISDGNDNSPETE